MDSCHIWRWESAVGCVGEAAPPWKLLAIYPEGTFFNKTTPLGVGVPEGLRRQVPTHCFGRLASPKGDPAPPHGQLWANGGRGIDGSQWAVCQSHIPRKAPGFSGQMGDIDTTKRNQEAMLCWCIQTKARAFLLIRKLF